MKTFKYKDITVTLYTDPHEFIKGFFEVPEGAELDMKTLPDSAGFSEITEKEIWIYIGKLCSFEELLSTVAHELGHLITGGFTKNPPLEDGFEIKHEEKAEHYETFVMDAYELAKIIEEMISK